MTEINGVAGAEAVLPDLQLALPGGQSCRLSDYRREQNLVALFGGGAECGPCRHAIVTDLCGRPEEYAEAGAAVVLVLDCSSMEAELVRRRDRLTIPVLLDPNGEACRTLGAVPADGKTATAVVVTDSAGRVCLESRPDRNDTLPTRDAIFRCLRSIPP